MVGTGDNIQAAAPDKTIETVIFEKTLVGMEDKIIEEDIEMIDIIIIRNRSRERTFTRNYSSGRDRSSSNSR